MMLRTHLAIIVLAVLLFFSHISGWLDRTIFVLVALTATYIPDIDSAFSTIGKYRATRLVQFFVKHRGLLHSFTFCIVVSLVFSFFIPILALPFFAGYGLHLLADSFTPEGIKPFWPWKRTLAWTLRTGGKRETTLFIFFITADLLVLFFMIKSLF